MSLIDKVVHDYIYWVDPSVDADKFQEVMESYNDWHKHIKDCFDPIGACDEMEYEQATDEVLEKLYEAIYNPGDNDPFWILNSHWFTNAHNRYQASICVKK